MSRLKVLVADDDSRSRQNLEKDLLRWGYEPVAADDESFILELLGQQDGPRLAVINKDMRSADASRLLERSRSVTGKRSPFLILLTPQKTAQHILSDTLPGADAYLASPYDPEEMEARLSMGRRVLDLETNFSKRMQEIEDTLQHIQRSFLFGKCPENLAGAQVAALTVPSLLVAGDFYDFHEYDPQQFDVLIGDVMGKGIKAALWGAAAVMHFSRSLCELSGTAGQPPAPAAIINLINRKMAQRLSEMESFITVFYGRFNLQKSSFEYVDGGHVKTIHYSAEANECRLLEGENVPLGFCETEEYTTSTVSFGEHDVFVFYSDGITEARNPDGELFGEQRLTRLVRDNAEKESQGIIYRIMEDVGAFVQKSRLGDDVTCVVVKIDQQPKTYKRSFETTSSFQNLTALRFFVRDFLHHTKLFVTEETILNLEMAVNEAAVCIIEKAYANAEGRPLRVEADTDSRTVRFCLSYEGPVLEELRGNLPAFGSSEAPRFGFFVIEQLADRVYFQKQQDNTAAIVIEKNMSRQEEH